MPAAETLPLAEARAELCRQQRMAGGRQPSARCATCRSTAPRGRCARGSTRRPSALGADPAPTMLFIHGGGWMYGDLESHDAACRFLAEKSGVQVLAIDYRLAPEHKFPAAVEDCQAAYRWLVDHADDVNADPARLAVGGDSAGGALSLSTAVVGCARRACRWPSSCSSTPAPTSWSAPTSRRLFGEGFVLTEQFMDRRRGGVLRDRTPTRPTRDASALRRVDFPAGLAPAHVVTAGYDPLRDEGEAYARAAGRARRRGRPRSGTRR